MLAFRADSLQGAAASDFLAALGKCSTLPADGPKSRATIVLKKLLRSAFREFVILPESVQLATSLMKLFQHLLSVADRDKMLAAAAWQALMAPFDRPGGMQTTLTSSNTPSQIRIIEVCMRCA